MKRALTALALALCLIGAFYASSRIPMNRSQKGASDTPFDQGRFLVLSQGTESGDERFKINANNTAESTGQLSISGTTVRITTSLQMTPATGQQHFGIKYEPGTAIDFAVDSGKVKATGGLQQTGQTDPDAIVLENNVWYHYYFLLRRYNQKTGGVQHFKGFIPTAMQTVPVSVEYKGPLDWQPPAQLDRFVVIASDSLRIELLTDSLGKLVYILIPSQQAEVVREEYQPSLARLHQLIAAPGPAERQPDYRAPNGASFTAEDVTLPIHNYKLAGTLLLPKRARRPLPAVVMITGSGQQDRDESIPIQGLENYRPFREIAEALADRGIAVLRVDDRGAGSSTGSETLVEATTSDFAEDTRSQVAFLRSRKEIDGARIALIGHSVGGTIASMVAATDERIAAVVFMAAPGKKGSEISLYQIEQALDSDPNVTERQKQDALKTQRDLIQALATGGDLSKFAPEAKLPWIKEYFNYDPLTAVKRMRQPLLILQGELDHQITPDNAQLLFAAARGSERKDAIIKVLPGLNHLFLPAQSGLPSEYGSLKVVRIPSQVLTIIGDWLQERLQASPKASNGV